MKYEISKKTETDGTLTRSCADKRPNVEFGTTFGTTYLRLRKTDRPNTSVRPIGPKDLRIDIAQE
jgi:hypothetical protein